jgi:AraC family transcriptional regulator, regulatory protein of adaptative response / methylated-DNA-[protein]-cysteine methyltransferase
MKKALQMRPAPGNSGTIARRSTKPPEATNAEAAYWGVVVARDRTFDGTFVYAVATTGVYCRPSCAARLAKRENVTFYANTEEARRAGFRPCKRCKPDELPRDPHNVQKITEACRWIAEAGEPPKLKELAHRAGLCPYHFHRVFKAVTGLTPKAYAMAHRQNRIRETLAKTGSVTEAVHDAGFNSLSRFYANSSDVLGMTPTEFRTGATEIGMRFAVGECALGSILVAASDKGIAAILLGSEPEALVKDLQDRFPNATLTGGDRAFEDVVAKVVGLVDAPGNEFDLPLDIRGTAFQHRVWQALCEIPPGATATYSEIAARIGMPNAVRAVAAACAANKIAVAIPCHRVVRNDGSLSGYRWGVERKRALLDREAGLLKPKPSRKRAIE